MELFELDEIQLERREGGIQDRVAAIKLSLRQGEYRMQDREVWVARADGVFSNELICDTVGNVIIKHHGEINDDAGVRGDNPPTPPSLPHY
jgi:hypothetical protein